MNLSVYYAAATCWRMQQIGSEGERGANIEKKKRESLLIDKRETQDFEVLERIFRSVLVGHGSMCHSPSGKGLC